MSAPSVLSEAAADVGLKPDPREADWVAALRAACERTSQARVAETLRQADGYPSPALINQVLQGKYQPSTWRLAALVRGAYLSVTVACPLLGALRLDDCMAHQRAPYLPSNALRVALFRACRACPNRMEEPR